MFKVVLAVLLFFVSNMAFGVDLKKLDMQSLGKGCSDMELYVYWIAKGSRDRIDPTTGKINGEDIKYTMQRLQMAYEQGKEHTDSTGTFHPAAPAVAALGQEYYDQLYAYIVQITKDVWRLKDISPSALAGVIHENCEAFHGETELFISFDVVLRLKGFESDYYLKDPNAGVYKTPMLKPVP